MKGQKMHQRSCRTLHGLNDNVNAKLQKDILGSAKASGVLSVDSQSIDIPENVKNTEEIAVLKRGVKLSKSAMDGRWLTSILVRFFQTSQSGTKD